MLKRMKQVKKFLKKIKMWNEVITRGRTRSSERKTRSSDKNKPQTTQNITRGRTRSSERKTRSSDKNKPQTTQNRRSKRKT